MLYYVIYTYSPYIFFVLSDSALRLLRLLIVFKFLLTQMLRWIRHLDKTKSPQVSRKSKLGRSGKYGKYGLDLLWGYSTAY